MTITKTYEDLGVKYYDTEDGYYRIIERKSGCTIKEKGNIFNIMGNTLGTTKTLEEAIKIVKEIY